MPRALWWSYGGVLFLMREVPLYMVRRGTERGGGGIAMRGAGFEWWRVGVMSGGGFESCVQGYLAHKKLPRPTILQ